MITYCIHKGKREATDGAHTNQLKRHTDNSTVEDRKRSILNIN